MRWGWLIPAVIVWLLSAICIIGTVIETAIGRKRSSKADLYGAIAFHGVTAIVALWLFLKALGKT